jgi:hypothetical protein
MFHQCQIGVEQKGTWTSVTAYGSTSSRYSSVQIHMAWLGLEFAGLIGLGLVSTNMLNMVTVLI